MQNAIYLTVGVLLLLTTGAVAFAWLRRSRQAGESRHLASDGGRVAAGKPSLDERSRDRVSPPLRDTDPAVVVPVRPETRPAGNEASPVVSSQATIAPEPSALRRSTSPTSPSMVGGWDSVTSLPNRAMFLEDFKQQLADLQRQPVPHCLAMVRIDRFGDILAERGVRASELVLAQTAERLRATMRDGDAVARFDRDTFVLSLAELSAKDAPNAVERLRLAACQEVEIENARSVFVTASSSYAPIDAGSEATELVACCRGALALAISGESLAVG